MHHRSAPVRSVRATRVALAAVVVVAATVGAACPLASAGVVGPPDKPGPNEVALSVDVVTGEVRFVGNAVDPAALREYQINSFAGSLDTTKWNSLNAQVGASWQPFTFGSNGVTETTVINAPLPIDDVGVSIGNLFRPGGTPDLLFSYFQIDNGPIGNNVPGAVTYVPEPASAAACVALPLALAARLGAARRRR